MITIGVVCLIVGYLLGIAFLWSLGIALVVIGAVLWFLGAIGREVGGRRHYY